MVQMVGGRRGGKEEIWAIVKSVHLDSGQEVDVKRKREKKDFFGSSISSSSPKEKEKKIER